VTTPAEDALNRARSTMAHAILGREVEIDEALGGITLRPHQRRAASRLLSLIQANRGALLAEPVGLGKTYTALAVARRWSSRLVIAPASLREMWLEAIAATEVDAELITHEALSRGQRPIPGAEVVVIDEAHRLRSPGTRRYATVADLCSRIPVLLLTATPIHNRRDDLAAQLALFLGRAAWQQAPAELAAHVVRDTRAEVRGLPDLDGPHRLPIDCEDDCLDALLALPAPIPASDEGTAAALMTYTLVHQWASSQAALVASLKRRLGRTLALRSAVESGRRPTRRELTAWSYADDAVQLAFAELVASPVGDDEPSPDTLWDALEQHASALSTLLARLRSERNVDVHRVLALREVRSRHPDAKVIAFSQYAETVDFYFRALAREPGVAALTSHGARVAGGRITRREVLAHFTPGEASRASSRAERIELLLTTDLLSEGLNLQEASVVVHLDLPWNPARLDQRAGRVRRLGSRHDVVSVYAVSPPASSERLLRIETRLREKLRVAQQTVGVAGRILPSPFGEPLSPESGLAESMGAVHAVLQRWLLPGSITARSPAIAAVRAPAHGWLAVVEDDRQALLVADIGGGIDTEPRVVRSALEHAAGEAVDCDAAAARAVLARLDDWLASRRGSASIDLRAALTARSRRAALARVAAALDRAPRHQRAALAPLAAAARAVVTTSLPEGAERVLDTLVRAELPDEAWLRSMAAFGELNARPQTHCVRAGWRVLAVILF
jgi:superfamily II DNA or RNA helicase